MSKGTPPTDLRVLRETKADDFLWAAKWLLPPSLYGQVETAVTAKPKGAYVCFECGRRGVSGYVTAHGGRLICKARISCAKRRRS